MEIGKRGMNKAPMALLSAKLACLTIATLASLATMEAKANWVGLRNQNGILQLKTQREFDYFALALQWPATYCRRSSHCCSSNACCRGSNAPAEFTIHGLWPDYNDGSWPACCTQKRFNEKEISTLLDALEKYWPSLSCSSPSTCHGGKGSFWAHEWEKHGTCSSPVTGDEYNYFLTTLNLYFKYNVTRVLYEAGYVPSNREKYPLGGIISAIQNAFHATPLVVCRNGALEELRLCFYKNFEPRDCVTEATQNAMISSSSSCPSYISLPEFVSRGVEGAETTIPRFPAEEAIQELGSM